MTRSTKHRSKLARPLLILLALVAVGLSYSVISPQTTSADSEMTQQIEEGKALFDVTCSSCHGLNAEGTSQGPSLIGVGAASVDFQMGTGRMPAARPEAQLPKREVIYSQEQIDAVAAYIDSLAPGVAIPDPSEYDTSALTADEVANGGALFRANCSACHGIVGGGGALPNGKYAPSLLETSDKHIWEAMRTGPQQMPVFSKDVMTEEEVREIIAYLDQAHAQPTYGGLGMGENGPVSEGFWVFIIGIGGLAGFALWIAKKGARAR
ncbi:MAG: c-type cytochrome [Arachnia sp.]